MNLYGNITKVELSDMEAVYLLRSIYKNKVNIDSEGKLGKKDPDKIIRYIEGHIPEEEFREKLGLGDEQYKKYFLGISYYNKGKEVKINPEIKPELEKRYYEGDLSKPDLPYWFFK